MSILRCYSKTNATYLKVRNTINALAEVIKNVLGKNIKIITVVYANASERRIKEMSIKSKIDLLICGSRDYKDLWKIDKIFETLSLENYIIIHGNAKGVDRYAGELAKKKGFEVMVYVAHWYKFGRAAGQIRNKEMAMKCDYTFVFWNRISRGTAGTLRFLTELKKPFDIIYEEN